MHARTTRDFCSRVAWFARRALGGLTVGLGLLVPHAHAAVMINMVTVGNPGNANDTTGYGAVNYEYQIGKYDVTVQQYTDFLTAVAATDTYSLYNIDMETNPQVAGISRRGSSGSYTYSVIGYREWKNER